MIATNSLYYESACASWPAARAGGNRACPGLAQTSGIADPVASTVCAMSSSIGRATPAKTPVRTLVSPQAAGYRLPGCLPSGARAR